MYSFTEDVCQSLANGVLRFFHTLGHAQSTISPLNLNLLAYYIFF